MSVDAGVSGTGSIKAPATPDAKKKDTALRKAAQEFEAYFVQQLFSQMRKGIPSGGMLHSKGEDMFRDLLDEQVSQDVAHGNNGFGLSDSLYRQLSLDEGRRAQ